MAADLPAPLPRLVNSVSADDLNGLTNARTEATPLLGNPFTFQRTANDSPLLPFFTFRPSPSPPARASSKQQLQAQQLSSASARPPSVPASALSANESWKPRLDLGLRALAREWAGLLSSAANLRNDLQAGFIIAFVSVPLSLAIAVGAGLPPEVGLLTAIVGAVVASLAGGTPLAVSGPAAAIVATCYSIYGHFGAAGVVLVTGACGALQALSGILSLGALARFVPVPVVAGFTGGIGVTVLVQQLPTALSLSKPPSSHSLDVLRHVAGAIGGANPASAALAAATVACILALPRVPFLGRLPATLTSVLALTAASAALALPVPSIGHIPSSLPAPRLPDFAFVSAANAAALASYTLVVFGVASVESLLSSSAVDRLSKARARRHDPDQELIGQGLANLMACAFGGMPVSSVIVRSSLNIQSGAMTRRSGVLCGAALVLVVYALTPLLGRIPMPVLAGVLISVALRMLSPREIREILGASRAEGLAWLATVSVVAAADVMAGVAVGVAVSAALALLRGPRGRLALAVRPALTLEEARAAAAAGATSPAPAPQAPACCGAPGQRSMWAPAGPSRHALRSAISAGRGEAATPASSAGPSRCASTDCVSSLAGRPCASPAPSEASALLGGSSSGSGSLAPSSLCSRLLGGGMKRSATCGSSVYAIAEGGAGEPVDVLELAGPATFLSSLTLARLAAAASALADASVARPALVDLTRCTALDISAAHALIDAAGAMIDAGKPAVFVGASEAARAMLAACDHAHRLHPVEHFAASLEALAGEAGADIEQRPALVDALLEEAAVIVVA
eukprot:tig00000241_g21032.t1